MKNLHQEKAYIYAKDVTEQLVRGKLVEEKNALRVRGILQIQLEDNYILR